MTLLYLLLAVYILSVNAYGWRLIKQQRDCTDAGERAPGDGKLLLAALLGGSVAIYAGMLAMKFRLTSFLLMVFLPLVAVLNLWCFYLGFRGIWMLL